MKLNISLAKKIKKPVDVDSLREREPSRERERVDDDEKIDVKTSAHEIYVKALKQAGFEVSVDPKKIGKSIVVSLGNEKEFTDAISAKLKEKFDTVEQIFRDTGASVEFVPGVGNRTIKYWGNVSFNGVPYVLDFTYTVGQAYTKINKE